MIARYRPKPALSDAERDRLQTLIAAVNQHGLESALLRAAIDRFQTRVQLLAAMTDEDRERHYLLDSDTPDDDDQAATPDHSPERRAFTRRIAGIAARLSEASRAVRQPAPLANPPPTALDAPASTAAAADPAPEPAPEPTPLPANVTPIRPGVKVDLSDYCPKAFGIDGPDNSVW